MSDLKKERQRNCPEVCFVLKIMASNVPFHDEKLLLRGTELYAMATATTAAAATASTTTSTAATAAAAEPAATAATAPAATEVVADGQSD